MRCAFGMAALLAASLAAPARAQKAPEAGYAFPPGGRAGTSVALHLGGYDWTPDLQYFVHRPGVKLEIAGELGPIYVPPPPYWFGPKAYSQPPPLPRELPARLTLPASLPPGPLRWQVAGASGGSQTAVFMVSAPEEGEEVLEDLRARRAPQPLPALPCIVNGRLSRVAEVDRYRFRAPRDGPLTLVLTARRLGSPVHGVLQVRDETGALLADVADTEGRDPELTFVARAGAAYEVAVHDVDFKGDRAYVYRLALTPGPRVVAAYPPVGRAGTTQQVRFVGVGLATGAATLESVVRQVDFPTAGQTVWYRVETPHGTAPAFPLAAGTLPEAADAADGAPADRVLGVPGARTAWLEKPGAVHRYHVRLTAGERWQLQAEARRFGSPLDLTLAVLGPDGREVARGDDAPGTTDVALELTVPATADYTLVVSEAGRQGGSQAAPYRLALEPATPDFALEAPQVVHVPVPGSAELTVKAVRRGGFVGPITLQVLDLPEGYSAPATVTLPEGAAEVRVPLTAAADAPAVAALIRLTGRARAGETELERPVLAAAAGNLAPRSPAEAAVPHLLLAGTLKPLFGVSPVDKDGGRTVHRGTTYPAPVHITRTGGFTGPVHLHMAARQSYIRQGIWGPEIEVPPGVSQALYPCHMPEWLETSRTSRMILIALAQLPDPRGRLRWVVVENDGRITMSIEGALLKVSHGLGEMTLPPGGTFEVPIRVARSEKLAESVRLELRLPEELAGMATAGELLLPPGEDTGLLRIATRNDPRLLGDQLLTIRAVALQEGRWPVVSETEVPVRFVAPAP